MGCEMRVPSRSDFDAVVVGGGFYGCCMAVFLSERLPRVALLEKQNDLITRASFVNQARIHNGYHYPRSFMTGLRSAFNFPRFIVDFKECIDATFEKFYAIAAQQSKVTAFQFESFCRNIGSPVRPAPPRISGLFNQDLIEAVFCVREYAFDASKLRQMMRQRLNEAGVQIMVNTEVERVSSARSNGLQVDLADGKQFSAELVFNCAYSQINKLLGKSGLPLLPLKHEITELALIEPPDELRGLGVTVMDGPFFSTMPFPALDLYSLSHVRYTPHESWQEPQVVRDPHRYLEERNPATKYLFMLKDAQRYLPCLGGARYVRSLFEVKTVLAQNEMDDGRPILFRRHPELGNAITIMGAKIDNIYDVLQTLNGIHDLSRKKAVLNGR